MTNFRSPTLGFAQKISDAIGQLLQMEAVSTQGASPIMVTKLALTAVTTTAGGGALSWANPVGVPIIIHRLIVNVTTEATGAATVDAGIASDGTTSSDTLLDALDVGSAAILTDNLETPGTNGQSCVIMSASQYLTMTASATLAGLVGTAYVEWSVA